MRTVLIKMRETFNLGEDEGEGGSGEEDDGRLEEER